MKKSICAVLLAAFASAGVQAATLTVVCGDHAVTGITGADNVIKGLEVDGDGYYSDPTITRRVVEGQLVTFAQAFNAEGDKLATLGIVENGNVLASVGTVGTNQKLLWQSKCRGTR